MMDVKQEIMKFVRDEEGLTAVEYAVAGALVVAGLITAFTGLGNAIVTRINALATAIS